MSINLIRYAAGAGPPGASSARREIVPLPGEYPTTADVLGEGSSTRGAWWPTPTPRASTRRP